MNFKLNKKYLALFFITFICEVIITVYINDNFIRPYMGDVFVVVLIYCFVKTFVQNELKYLPLYIFAFAVLVEIAQYFNWTELLGIKDYKTASMIIGTTFDIKDIVCYLTGCLFLLFAQAIGKAVNKK